MIQVPAKVTPGGGIGGRQCVVKQGKRTGRESFWDVNGEDTLFALGGMLQALYTECVTEESSRAAIAQLAQGGGHVGSNSRKARVLWHYSGSGFSTGSEVVAAGECGGGGRRHQGHICGERGTTGGGGRSYLFARGGLSGCTGGRADLTFSR